MYIFYIYILKQVLFGNKERAIGGNKYCSVKKLRLTRTRAIIMEQKKKVKKWVRSGTVVMWQTGQGYYTHAQTEEQYR